MPTRRDKPTVIPANTEMRTTGKRSKRWNSKREKMPKHAWQYRPKTQTRHKSAPYGREEAKS